MLSSERIAAVTHTSPIDSQQTGNKFKETIADQCNASSSCCRINRRPHPIHWQTYTQTTLTHQFLRPTAMTALASGSRKKTDGGKCRLDIHVILGSTQETVFHVFRKVTRIADPHFGHLFAFCVVHVAQVVQSASLTHLCTGGG